MNFIKDSKIYRDTMKERFTYFTNFEVDLCAKAIVEAIGWWLSNNIDIDKILDSTMRDKVICASELDLSPIGKFKILVRKNNAASMVFFPVFTFNNDTVMNIKDGLKIIPLISDDSNIDDIKNDPVYICNETFMYSIGDCEWKNNKFNIVTYFSLLFNDIEEVTQAVNIFFYSMVCELSDMFSDMDRLDFDLTNSVDVDALGTFYVSRVDRYGIKLTFTPDPELCQNCKNDEIGEKLLRIMEGDSDGI